MMKVIKDISASLREINNGNTLCPILVFQLRLQIVEGAK
jgi:hypothetical protein